MKKLALSSIFCLSLFASFFSYPQAVFAMDDDDSGKKTLVSKLSKYQQKKAKKEISRHNRHQRKTRAKQARNARASSVVQKESSANNASALSLVVVVSASSQEQLSASEERGGAAEERKYSSAKGESIVQPVVDRGSGSNSISSLALPDGRQWVLDTLYGNDCEFNYWYNSSHGYRCGAGHVYPKYPSNKRAFQAGFRRIVLNEGSEDREQEVLLPTRKVLTYYIREWAEFPSALVRDYPHEFPVIPADKDLAFSWTALCDLSLLQHSEGDHYFLNKLYSYFSTLQKLNRHMKGDASSSSSLRPLVEEAFDPSNAAWLSGLGNFVSVSRYCPRVFSPCAAAIEKLYRVSFLRVLERGGLDERWSMISRLQGPSKEFMLDESISASQNDQLFTEAEQEILKLARARWRTTQAMGHHLQFIK